MKTLNYIRLTLILIAGSAFGQQELTLFHMNNLLQSSYVNPTAIPEFNVSIGLPGISSFYTTVSNSSFRANDLKAKTGDSVYFTMDKALSKMDKSKNYLRSDQAIDLLSLRFKVRNLYFTLNATEKVNVRFTYPKDFFSLLNKGNAQFIGNEANFDGIALNATHYREFGLGVTRHKDGGKWTYGVRGKILYGLDNISFAKSKARLTVDDQFYQNALEAQFTINSSSPLNQDSPDYDTLIEDGDEAALIKAYGTNTTNMGLALDGGVTYQLNKKLSFTAALNNLGYINWKYNPVNYKVDGSYQFSGINIDDLGNDSINGEALVDSIVKTFEPKKSYDSYKTRLSPQLFLSVQYMLGRNTQVAATFYAEFYQGMRPAISVSISQRAGRILNLIASYSAFKNSYNNLGLGVMIKPGPFQFYVVGDNMLALANPFNTNFFNVRTGMNLVFGKIRKPEAPSHNE